MRSKLIGLLLGFGLAAIVAPALACDFQMNSASSNGAAQQTAQSEPATDAGRN